MTLARWLALLSSLAMFQAGAMSAQVQLTRKGDAYQLLRGGRAYSIRGAGGDEKLWSALAAAGGNSVRLWGDDKLGAQLDAAQRAGLTVSAGIWLPQIRQGFDYTNAQAVAGLREHVRSTVLRCKAHPALLLWALGNEMEDPPGRNLAVWTVVNELAGLVKQIDPDHPVMTVVAEIGGEKVANVERLCPNVDILGINSYAGAQSLGDRYRQLGGRKPYILTEFGPPGSWETSKDATGAYPEPTSSQKAGIYRAAYERAVLAQSGRCLGSYAFFWGQKQEVTATWFSLFLNDGTRLGAVDTLSTLWTGKAPSAPCPTIELKLDGASLVKPGALAEATLKTSAPARDSPAVEWVLTRDPEVYGSGGDAESPATVYPEAILGGNFRGAKVQLPASGGLYRLFATVRDGHGGGAVANVPIRVEGPASVAKGHPVTLPVVLAAQNHGPASYVPAGWMGNVEAIRFDPAWPLTTRSGASCLRCEFAAASGWGGIAWQSPASDWGDLDGGYDLTGAKRLVFRARGEHGGEKVDFKFGVIPKSKKFFDTASGALPNVVLTPDWQQYEIRVDQQDLSRIKTGFVWSVAGTGQPVVFYLDDIRWE